MQRSVWHFHGREARLETGALTAVARASQPGAGLTAVRFLDTPLDDLRVLQLGIDLPQQHGEEGVVEEAYVRGDDLIAVYKVDPERHVRRQVHWRYCRAGVETRTSSALRVIVSSQTDLLDADPRFLAVSELPCDEAWRLVDADAGRFERVSLRAGETICAKPQDGTSLFLFRLPDRPISYAEMVHPADYQSAELTAANDSRRGLKLSYSLGEERIEKGVIRRVQILGVFLAREDDQHRAAEFFRQLAREKPPLGA